MRLLLINPNTSQALTERLHDHVQAVIGEAAGLDAVTARFGARYIADEASFAVAGHAALDAYAAHAAAHGEPDAVLLGCFGDPGVWALRQVAPCPVIGLAEAAMHEAAAFGRFAIVTGGAAWQPMLERLARTLGFAGALAGVHVVPADGAQLAADPALAQRLLASACAAASASAHAVILGGAGLAGLAGQLAPSLEVPLVDSVTAGARTALALARGGTASPRPQAGSAGWHGVSQDLLKRLG